MKLKTRFAFILSISLLVSCSIDNKPSKYKIKGEALGTTYNVNYYSNKKQNLKTKFDSIFDVINQSLSTYIPESDISKINKGSNVKVDNHFKNVFQVSKTIYQNTDGYFDPSIGIMVNAYGFGPEKYDLKLNSETIDSLMNFVGYKYFKLEDNHIQTDLKSFYLDFNAVAKGYAVDVIADFLKQKGMQNFFVEIGGEVVTNGRDLDNDKIWNFGIETPSEKNFNRDLFYAITIQDKALATSGNYRKFKIDTTTGQRFVHTINPKTGLSEKSNVLSSSVVAETCAVADAYATAFMAMGYDKAKIIIEEYQISALLIFVDDNNNIKTFMTDDLKELTFQF